MQQCLCIKAEMAFPGRGGPQRCHKLSDTHAPPWGKQMWHVVACFSVVPLEAPAVFNTAGCPHISKRIQSRSFPPRLHSARHFNTRVEPPINPQKNSKLPLLFPFLLFCISMLCLRSSKLLGFLCDHTCFLFCLFGKVIEYTHMLVLMFYVYWALIWIAALTFCQTDSCYNFLDVRYYSAWQLSAMSKSLNLVIIHHAHIKNIFVLNTRNPCVIKTPHSDAKAAS